ncbi:QacE family quaternary ammonium compound efflux SMR transporter [Ornithinibacillus sp. BX22]|uniref:QacE family quaternary ammonium compound efflux SMR transporter n=1 Tax=Ornithinibacillus hominis TaxID=2763055 RepID=A0A923L6H2_9BACI|nr:SMR family transporter [Ornithinibacillus hominis]MBC5637301.1 QacE family quaternary ammonium compound efflux SMR transporter [Ornithinibacillus hominis]
MGWIYIILAAVNELIGVWGLNRFSQKRNVANAVLYAGGLGLSFAFIYASFNYLPTSIAYATWTGVGTGGVVLMNMLFFGESKSLIRIVSLLAIIIGVTGLKVL